MNRMFPNFHHHHVVNVVQLDVPVIAVDGEDHAAADEHPGRRSPDDFPCRNDYYDHHRRCCQLFDDEMRDFLHLNTDRLNIADIPAAVAEEDIDRIIRDAAATDVHVEICDRLQDHTLEESDDLLGHRDAVIYFFCDGFLVDP